MDRERHSQKTQNGKGLDKKVGQPVGDTVFNDQNIIGDASHELASTFLAKIIQRKTLDLFIKFLPDVPHDPLGDIVHDVFITIRGTMLDQHADKNHPR